MNDYKRFLDDALSMAKAAGDIHLEYFRSTRLDIHTKLNDSDVVTAADKAAENVVVSAIRKKYPGHGIIAEESGSDNENSEWRWVIDPLDGTTNFSQGLPVFCVSIALEHYARPVAGVVFAPYLGELFHAVEGGGAFLNGKRIHCSDKDVFSECVLATGMPYDKRVNADNNLKEIALMAPIVRGIRRMGSAAIDLSYVAAGFYDAYWELNLNRWDISAGLLIAKEAGAKVYSIRNDRNFSLMAASPGVAGEMVRTLSSLSGVTPVEL